MVKSKKYEPVKFEKDCNIYNQDCVARNRNRFSISSSSEQEETSGCALESRSRKLEVAKTKDVFSFETEQLKVVGEYKYVITIEQ